MQREKKLVESSTLVQVRAPCAKEVRANYVRIAIRCTIWHSTRVIPFRFRTRPGDSLYEQIVYAAKKAIISGHLRPGDPFPSVRTLSKELKINPNTAHKVISELVDASMLETRAGVGTVVSSRIAANAAERTALLGREMEELVVEAKVLGIQLQDVMDSIAAHWRRLATRRK